MEALTEAVVSLAQSPWVYAIVFAVSMIDGFFPPIPSESVIVALAALSVSLEAPDAVGLTLVSAGGAFVGDNIAYWLGRWIPVDRLRWMSRPRVALAMRRARAGLLRRPAVILLTARYIPIGRVAVNATAGMTRFPYRRFVAFSFMAANMWAVYSVVIGAVAGAWLHEHPMIAAVLAIILAVVIGFVIDGILSRIARRRGGASGLSPTEEPPSQGE